MERCLHQKLVLLPGSKKKMRCTRCHLTIDADELGDGYCPECFDADGSKQYDFQEVEAGSEEGAWYRCETCGIRIPVDR